ncbi:MAG: hypothetical protein R6X12_05965 [bacterium]
MPPLVPKLLCPTCGRYDTTYVEYTCTTGLHSEVEPPKPTGHPATRTCPTGAPDGCSGMETGRVIACTSCAGGLIISFV